MTPPNTDETDRQIKPAARSLRRAAWKAGVGILVLVTAAFAWSRVGLLGLPTLPSDLTLQDTGLSGLAEMSQLDRFLRAAGLSDRSVAPGNDNAARAAAAVRAGLADIKSGDAASGLQKMQAGLRLDPDNLVLANAYRMSVFQLQRDFLQRSRTSADPTPLFPAHLDHQPIAFFELLAHEHPSAETRLHLALAWVDHMLLFPALEIKAPSSVESVKILNSILETRPNYVPALFARGMNHLHRPSRLVWPETKDTPPDAAVRDFARCVAIGRQFDVGSPRLQAKLALALGDAYIKAGRLSNARSWWQIAQNLCRDDDLQQAVRRRYAWRDEDALDRLEEELDRTRSDLEQPLTNLALMWE